MVSAGRALKIAIVTQYYKPENAKIPQGVAQTLAERGHEVRVITGYPNYPEGRLYPGYRQRLVGNETDGLVHVRRVPLVISHSQNPISRFASYVSFALSSLSAGQFVRDVDVVYVYATQMTAAFAPSVWFRNRGIPFVLHVQDLWPESVTGSSMIRGSILKKVIDRCLRPWLNAAYNHSAAVIAIAPTMHRMLADRGVDKRKIHTVLNWADETNTQHRSLKSDSSEPDDPSLAIVYAGNFGVLQDLETVVRAAAQVKDLSGFKLTLVGAGVSDVSIRSLARELNATNVVFRGRVPYEGMAKIYALSDFQMIPLRDLEVFRGTIPSKLQGSLANAIPVITTVAGDVGDIVVKGRMGFVSTPGDVDALAAVFRSAYALAPEERRAMGERARLYYAAEMSMSSGIDKIEDILLSVSRIPRRKKSCAKKLRR